MKNITQEQIWHNVAGVCMAQGIPVPTGDLFFANSDPDGRVDQADDADHGLTYDKPTATLNYASGLCRANNGDVVVTAPNHAEAIDGAGALNLAAAGITVICLGNSDDRGTFTINGAVGNDIDVGADNVTIIGARFVNTEDGATGPLDINAANCRLLACEFINDTVNTVAWIVAATAAADGLVVKDCVHRGWATAGDTCFLDLNAVDRFKVINLISRGDFSAGNIRMHTAACTEGLIRDCFLENLNAVAVNIEGNSLAGTGFISKNALRVLNGNTKIHINNVGGFSLYENYGVNQDGETGMLLGTVSTT